MRPVLTEREKERERERESQSRESESRTRSYLRPQQELCAKWEVTMQGIIGLSPYVKKSCLEEALQKLDEDNAK